MIFAPDDKFEDSGFKFSAYLVVILKVLIAIHYIMVFAAKCRIGI